MSKDVKIELIYFKSSTDVSLEFGLHGDYPLRLLSINTNDRAEFFHSLKRAVSRSEIIIIIGGYRSKEYLPSFLAKAIGRRLVTSDNGDHGILMPGTVSIPDGAIPLVIKGKFGGFIIESGPQTIFSLTDDRNIRLAITKDIIVSYIAEYYRTFCRVAPAKPENPKNPQDVAEAETAVTVQPPTEFTDISSLSDIKEAPMSSDSVFLPKHDIPPEENRQTNAEETLEETENIGADNELGTNIKPPIERFDDNSGKTVSGKRIAEKPKAYHETRVIRILCIILSLLVIVATVAFVFLFPKIDAQRGYYASLARTYDSNSDDPSDAFRKVQAQNSSIFTWLKLDIANIDHPVVTVADVSDTSKYLTTLPNGDKDPAGTLFSTTAISPNIAPKNTVIYGNADIGGALKGLSRIPQDADRYIGNVVKTADSSFQAEWSIFSVFTHSAASGFDYTCTEFADTGAYIEYLTELRQLSTFESDTSFIGNETLLLLVGIAGEERYVVAAALTAVRILSEATPTVNNIPSSSNNNNDDNSSDPSDVTSSDVTSSEITTTSEPEDIPEIEDNDFYGESPDIVLPPPPADTSSSDTSSKESSVVSSSNETSSAQSSSEADSSAETSSEATSAAPSQPSEAPPTSSAAASSQPATPPVDPIYTWDKEFTITDSATGIKYTASAVDMVAMIIEDEMSPTIDPPEALIAQAIVKYNWLLHNNGNSNALDPNPTPQAKQYAAAAKGSVIMYGNTIAKTYCYAYSAGKTANYQDIWGGTAYPYLQSVDCAVDEQLKDFITTTTYSADLINTIIKNKCGIDVSGMPKSEWLKPVQYDANGLYCLKISIGGKEYNGRYLRETLLTKANTGVSAIRSTAYTITYNAADDTFTVSCKGYGHGVGLSQRGAKAYANLGWTHGQIIAHFFPGTTLIKH